MKQLKNKVIVGMAAFCVATSGHAQTWSTYSLTSTSAAVSPTAMTEDSSGYVYTVGSTTGSNKNIVVMKFSSSGSLVSSVELGGSELEQGYDIAYGPDGKLYVLGKYQDITNSGNPKLYVACLNTSLSTSWQQTVTAYEPNGTTLTDQILPYRLSLAGTAQSPIVYATAQVNDSNLHTGINLQDPTNAKAVFYCKLDSSGTVSWSGTWDGQYGKPDSLFGTHAVSNGLVFVTQSKLTISGFDYDRTYYTKIDGSSGSVSWSSTPLFTTPGNSVHKLAQTVAHGDSIYTSLQEIPPVTDFNMYDMVLSLDGSRTTAPSTGDWAISAYEWYAPNMFNMPPIYNAGLGVAYWNSQVVALGRGMISVGGMSIGVDDQPSISSWVRTLGGSIIDSGTDTSDSNTALRYVPEPNQRCFDATSEYLMATARGFTNATSFWFLSYKNGASPARSEGTITLASGYTTYTYSPGPVQVMTSKVGNSAYVLLDVVNGSGVNRVALYKFDR